MLSKGALHSFSLNVAYSTVGKNPSSNACVSFAVYPQRIDVRDSIASLLRR
jgi:hypothetical protein